MELGFSMILILSSLIFLFIVCMYMCGHMCAMAHVWMSENNVQVFRASST